MIRLWFCLVLALAAPAAAAPVTVTSGEHDGFTRLVFDYGRVVDWQMGRGADGYELRLAGTAATYDLRQAFDLIGRSRLAAIWVDPETSAVHVGLACACHAIPFEFRPGIIVVDLKDGPPPQGSSFELTLDGTSALPLQAPPARRPKSRPTRAMTGAYNWLAQRNEKEGPLAPKPAAPALLPPDPALQPLRDSLLHQMARGAAQGVIDMAEPAGTALPDSSFPSAQIRIGLQPDHVRAPADAVQGNLTAKGQECLPPEIVDVAAWGDPDRPAADQLSDIWHDVVGEFDHIEPEPLLRAIRFQLYLGFGAEARQTIAAFAPEDPNIKALKSLSYLLDEEPDPAALFAGQAACDGPAALWAMLAEPAPEKGDAVNDGAIRLAFSALPLHLRHHLGPRLAERFLAMDNPESARALQDAILRAPGEKDANVTLMEADLARHGGDLTTAEGKIADVLADPGPNEAEALIALTDVRVSQGLAVDPGVAQALQSMQEEYAGTDMAARLGVATVKALAASGDVAAAFAALPEHPEATADVWALVASLATDADFLSVAVPDNHAPPPNLSDEVSQTIARRLLGFGLAQPALEWLQTVENPDPLLAAQVYLGLSDGRQALIKLAGIETPEAAPLKLQALALIGQEKPRADLLAGDDNPEAASAALARAGEWSALAQSGAEPWKAVAARIEATTDPIGGPTPQGPLALGHQLASSGAETRAAVEALLGVVPRPAE